MVTAATVETRIVVSGQNKFKTDIKKAETNIQRLGKSIRGLSLASVTGFGIAGFAVGNFVKESTQASIAFEQRFNSFTRLIEGDATRFLNSLSKAAEGTVSNLSLVTQANNAILLGIKQEQLPELLKAARLLGAAVGRTTEEAFGDLTIGIGRQSRLILDNLGIIVKSEQAYKDYAKAIGKSVSDLTTQEKQIAFNKAVMDAVEISVGKLEGSISEATTATQQMSAAWDNLKVSMGEKFAEALVNTTNRFSKLREEIINTKSQLLTLRADVEDFLESQGFNIIEERRTQRPVPPEIQSKFDEFDKQQELAKQQAEANEILKGIEANTGDTASALSDEDRFEVFSGGTRQRVLGGLDEFEDKRDIKRRGGVVAVGANV